MLLCARSVVMPVKCGHGVLRLSEDFDFVPVCKKRGDAGKIMVMVFIRLGEDSCCCCVLAVLCSFSCERYVGMTNRCSLG